MVRLHQNLLFFLRSLICQNMHAGDEIAARALIKQGAYVDVANAKKLTPLHEACASNHYNIAQILVT